MESLSEEEVASLMNSPEYGQAHLFPHGQSSGMTTGLVEQLKYFERSYPGGLLSYLSRARSLLADSAAGTNPFEGSTLSVPIGDSVDPEADLEHFLSLEAEGIPELCKCGFVLVAGGLGERLGYSSMKVSLPVELLTSNSFLELYIQSITAISERAGKELPLAIMTSEDTHEPIFRFLEENKYFGMDRALVTLLKQEKVPALCDNNATIAVEDAKIVGKPHGHGDVHSLLFRKGLAGQWLAEGIEWVLFFQDTNPLVFKPLASFLGASRRNDFAMNFLAVPRSPKESLGAIMTLVSGGLPQTMSVEYNLVDALIKDSGLHPGGDVSNEVLGLPGRPELSPFPGNTNTLLYHLPNYFAALSASEGHVPEFVNPKYRDGAKTEFKAPTRIESMMQDFSKLFTAQDRVGFTMYPRWFSFTATKNSLAEAAVKSQQGLDPWSAGSTEDNVYSANCKLLELAGAHVEPNTEEVEFGGIRYTFPAKVVLMPSFAVSFSELQCKVLGDWWISHSSALILDGKDTVVNGLKLNSHLVLGESRDNLVKEDGEFPVFVAVETEDPEYLQIRGFKLQHN